VVADLIAARAVKTTRQDLAAGREYRVATLIRSIVANANFDTISEVLGRGSENRFVIAPIGLSVALCCGIEAIWDEVEQHPRDLLREQIDFARGRIKGSLQSDIEAVLLGARAVIGEIKALLDQSVDLNRSVFAGALARM
jgi:hypothetical protein